MSDMTQPSLISRLKARYERNAASPDGARTRKAAMIGTVIGLALLGSYRLWHRSNSEPAVITTAHAEPGLVQGKLPACDSPFAQNLLKQAVETNPSPILGPVKVHKVGVIADYMALVIQQANDTSKPHITSDYFAETQNMRRCMAQLFTSRGRHAYNFTMTFPTESKDEVYLQAELGE